MSILISLKTNNFYFGLIITFYILSVFRIGNCSNIDFFIIPNNTLAAGSTVFLTCQVFIKERKLCELRIKLIIDIKFPMKSCFSDTPYSMIESSTFISPPKNSYKINSIDSFASNYIPLPY